MSVCIEQKTHDAVNAAVDRSLATDPGVVARLREADRRLRAAALYDPKRDGPPRWRDCWAMILGGPPVGRRALLDMHAEGVCQ